MRRLLLYLFRRPVLWLSKKFDAKPDKEKIYEALSTLRKSIMETPGKKGLVIAACNLSHRFVILSDQHKGRRNGADDFTMSEPNYIAALQHYYQQGYTFINLGDCEELWKNTLPQVKKANTHAFAVEKMFLLKNKYFKVYGNHDLYWSNDPLAGIELEAVYGKKIKVYEGVIIAIPVGDKILHVFCTHGHQGDARSDGNWLAKLFIARIWAPVQAYLRINTNEPSNDDYKKTVHNEIMYEWSSGQKNTILITGHTHQPVFESLTHLERLNRKWLWAKEKNDVDTIQQIDELVKPYRSRFDTIHLDYDKYSPSYFNTGCCCYTDGDITGIEIEDSYIRLIKWKMENSLSKRIVLEEKPLAALMG